MRNLPRLSSIRASCRGLVLVSERCLSDCLEHDALGGAAGAMREVGLDRDAREHLAQSLGGFPEILDLAVAQIDLEGADLSLAVPGAVLVGDGDDAVRPVVRDERLEAAPEEVEVLGNEIEQRQGLDAARHGHEVGIGPGAEVLDREVLHVLAPPSVDAGDDDGVGTGRVPGDGALVDSRRVRRAQWPSAFFSASTAAASVLACTRRLTSM